MDSCWKYKCKKGKKTVEAAAIVEKGGRVKFLTPMGPGAQGVIGGAEQANGSQMGTPPVPETEPAI